MYDFSEIIFDAAKNYWNISKIKKNNGTSFYQFLKLVRVKKKYFLNFCDISWFFSPVKMCAFIFFIFKRPSQKSLWHAWGSLGHPENGPQTCNPRWRCCSINPAGELPWTHYFSFWFLNLHAIHGWKNMHFLHVFGYNSGINHSIMISNTSN